MPRPSKFRALLGGVLLVLFSAHFHAQSTLTGTWVWNGRPGWQHITLDLTTNGNRLTGSISLGRGSKAGTAEDWEYFFEPATFPITNGIVNGSTFTFEQILPIGPMSSPVQGRGAPTRGTAGRVVPEHLKYSGQIKDNTLVITREIAPKVNDPFSLGSHKVTFTLRRSGSVDKEPASAKVTPATIEAFVPAVSLDVEVMDGAGAPALSLTKGDFAVREDGEPRPILGVIPPSAPQNVLLMFDHNLTWLKDSARPQDRADPSGAWDRLFQSSVNFIGQLRNQDRIAIGVFEESTKPVLAWRGARTGTVRVNVGEVLQPPAGQKDVYGMLRWAVEQFAKMNGRKSAVIFTDGRDGRLSPRWFRDFRGHEVIDPLFGLVDDGEADEFAAVLDCVKQSGVKLHFIVVNSDQDPEFGPAVVGRRISGLYPGSTEGIRDYLAGVRSRLKQLAEVSGGRVLYGNTPQDALMLYRDLHLELGIGKLYTLEFVSGRPADGTFRALEASVSNGAYRVTQYQTGYVAQ